MTKKPNTPGQRRALQFGAFIEHIERRKLWDMYQGICALCKQPLPIGKMTIDHIVPLSMGGMHEYANVQPAHGICNYVKGDGEFSMEKLEEALARRKAKKKRRSKGYRNRTGAAGVPLTT